MKKIIFLMAILTLSSCRFTLKKQVQSFYKDKEILFNLELHEKFYKKYYGVLKVANISNTDIALDIDHNNFYLKCDKAEFRILKDSGWLGLYGKIRFFIKKNEIFDINVVLESEINPSSCQLIELKFPSDSYRETKIISEKKSKEEIRQIINNMDSDDGVLFVNQ